MVGRVSQQVHQRISDLIDDGTIQLGLLTSHIQLHLLAEFPAQVTNHTREPVDHALDGHHADLHDRLMQVRRNSLQILDLIIERLVITDNGFTVVAGSYQSVLGYDQLADEVHQLIQLVDIDTDGTASDFCFISATGCLLLVIMMIIRCGMSGRSRCCPL